MKFKIVLQLLDPSDKFVEAGVLLPLFASIDRLHGSFTVVVVNNSSPQSSPKLADFLARFLTNRAAYSLLQQSENLGISYGLNRGAQLGEQDYDILVMMSGDALLSDEKLLQELAKLFQTYPDVGCAHPRSIFEDAPTCVNLSDEYSVNRFREHLKKGPGHCELLEPSIVSDLENHLTIIRRSRKIAQYPLPTLPLTFFAVRRELYIRLAGFDEAFSCGHENNDFVLRSLRVGFSAAIAKRCLVYHKRLTFRNLGQTGASDSVYRRLSQTSSDAWKQKYGTKDGLVEMFYEARFGSTFTKILLPLMKTAYKNIAVVRAIIQQGKYEN